MKLRYLALLAIACFPLTAATDTQLLERLRATITRAPFKITLYAKNLDSGATVGIGENDPVRTASTIKLPIMLAVFDAVAQHKADWSEPLVVTRQEKVSGSGVIGTEISEGVTLPMRDVVNLMMVLSDNSATNMLIERFTADAANAYLGQAGHPHNTPDAKGSGRWQHPQITVRFLRGGEAPRKREVRARPVHPERYGDHPRKA